MASMGKEPIRVANPTRRSLRVRIGSGAVAVVNTAWLFVNTTVSAANLPSDASDAWKTIVSVPWIIPLALVALSLGVLAWSLLPRKEGLAAAPHQPITPKSTYNMPLHAVFRHVAYDSDWAATYDRFADHDRECRRDGEYALAKEVREALARGEVSARGRHHIPGTSYECQLASSPIPTSFWADAFLQPFNEILLADDGVCIASIKRRTNDDPRGSYQEVVLSSEEVLARWPQRRDAGQNAPTQLATDVEAYKAKMGSRAEIEYDSEWNEGR
jgi:hypothetical protein